MPNVFRSALIAAALLLPAVHAAPMDAGFNAYIAEARAVVAAIDAGKAKAQGSALTALAKKADAMIARSATR